MISPSLTAAFLDGLTAFGVEVRFFSGSWENFDLSASGARYDLILTSETIYRVESISPLLDLMWRGCTDDHKSLEDLTSKLDLMPTKTAEEQPGILCIVSAKLVYFGVGGGVAEFVDAVENPRLTKYGREPGTVGTVWKNEQGVKRCIMRVRWT